MSQWFPHSKFPSSVQFSHSVVYDSLRPHGLQQARPPCPSPTPGVYSNSCPLSQWCYPTISSSVIPFPSAFNLSQHQGLFKSQFFASGSQSISVWASTSVIPMSIQNWFPLGWTVGSPCSPRDSQESSPTPQFKSISSSVLRFLYSQTLTSIHDYWKNHSFERVTGRKARGFQTEEIACKCQTLLSLLSGRREQTSDIFSFSIQI